jgi:hypothetical protein
MENSAAAFAVSTPSSPPTQEAAEEDAAEKKRKRRRLRRTILILDVVAVLIWTYFFFKLFVVDIDRIALQRLAPWSVSLLGFRFLVWIGILVALVGFFKHVAWLYLAYIAFFPFIVIFWKIPRLVYRRGSWIFFVGIVNAAADVVQSLRYSVVSKGLALIAAVLALTLHVEWIVFLCSTYLLLLLMWSYWRTLRASFQRSRFLTMQDQAINSIMDSDVVKTWSQLAPEFKRDDVALYSQAQVQMFCNGLQNSVILNRGLYFWAYQLEQYRQTVASLVLSLLSWFLLLLATIATLTVANVALYHVDPHQFTAASVPTVLEMTLYSFTSLALNTSAGIESAGDWAVLIRIVAGFLGVVLLLGVLSNVIFSIRKERDSSQIAETVRRIKQRAVAQEEQLRDQYDVVTIEDAITRLQRISAGLLGIVTWLTSSLPPGFIEDAQDD